MFYEILSKNIYNPHKEFNFLTNVFQAYFCKYYVQSTYLFKTLNLNKIISDFQLFKFIDDVLLEVLVLLITAFLKLFFLFVEDELPDQAVVFQSVLLSFNFSIDLFAIIDSLSKVVIPAEWHWEYRKGVQELSLKKFMRFQSN